MLTLGYIGAVGMGLTLGLIGGGGSILAVPILVYLFGMPGGQATFSSLFIVGVCAAAGAIPMAKRGLVSFKTAGAFFLPSVIGVWLARRVLLPAVPDSFRLAGQVLNKDLLILILFGFVMLAASWSMLKRGPAPEMPSTRIHPGRTVSTGITVGLITGFVGAGGGFLIVPALVNGLSLPMESAIGTSLLIIALNSLSGFAGDWFSGASADWKQIVPFSIASLGGIVLGTQLNRRIPGRKLKPAFGWFVLLLGTFMILMQVRHLS